MSGSVAHSAANKPASASANPIPDTIAKHTYSKPSRPESAALSGTPTAPAGFRPLTTSTPHLSHHQSSSSGFHTPALQSSSAGFHTTALQSSSARKAPSPTPMGAAGRTAQSDELARLRADLLAAQSSVRALGDVQKRSDELDARLVQVAEAEQAQESVTAAIHEVLQTLRLAEALEAAGFETQALSQQIAAVRGELASTTRLYEEEVRRHELLRAAFDAQTAAHVLERGRDLASHGVTISGLEQSLAVKAAEIERLHSAMGALEEGLSSLGQRLAQGERREQDLVHALEAARAAHEQSEAAAARSEVALDQARKELAELQLELTAALSAVAAEKATVVEMRRELEVTVAQLAAANDARATAEREVARLTQQQLLIAVPPHDAPQSTAGRPNPSGPIPQTTGSAFSGVEIDVNGQLASVGAKRVRSLAEARAQRRAVAVVATGDASGATVGPTTTAIGAKTVAPPTTLLHELEGMLRSTTASKN